MITKFTEVFERKRGRLNQTIQWLNKTHPDHPMVPTLKAELAQLNAVVSNLGNCDLVGKRKPLDVPPSYHRAASSLPDKGSTKPHQKKSIEKPAATSKIVLKRSGAARLKFKKWAHQRNQEKEPSSGNVNKISPPPWK